MLQVRLDPSILLMAVLSVTFPGCSDDSKRIEELAEHGESPTARTSGFNEHRNVYFGDLHVHTRYSFDAYLLGNEVTPDDSYRFAKGEAIEDSFGLEMQLREPLDFFAVSDHGFFLGVVPQWADPSTAVGKLPGAEVFHNINGPENLNLYSSQKRAVLFREKFGTLMRMPGGFWRGIRASLTHNPALDSASFDYDAHLSAWQDSVSAAQRHNDPGTFTAFIAYEWTASTPAPESAAYHRNVIFASSKAPARPFTRIDSSNPEDLWGWMDTVRGLGLDSLAIPHNPISRTGRCSDSGIPTGAPSAPPLPSCA